MLDHCNMDISYLDRSDLLTKLDSQLIVEQKTGEVKSEYAKYHGLTFKFNRSIKVSGSFHHFYNEYFCKDPQNYDLFTLAKFRRVVDHLCDTFNIIPEKTKIHTLEYNLTPIINHDPSKIIDDNTFAYKLRGPQESKKIERISSFRKYFVNNTEIKFYDKSSSNKLEEHRLRFEIKRKKSRLLPGKITHLSDLLNPENWHLLFKDILKEYDNLLIVDDVADYSVFSQSELLVFEKGINVQRWGKFKEASRKSEYKKRFFELLERKDLLKLKKEIREDICNVYTDIMKDENVMFTPVIEKCIDYEETIHRKCKVTGIDISHQKADSKFICEKTINHLYYQDHKTFQEISKEFLNVNRSYTGIEEICYYIAHNVRNKYWNLEYRKADLPAKYENSLFPV